MFRPLLKYQIIVDVSVASIFLLICLPLHRGMDLFFGSWVGPAAGGILGTLGSVLVTLFMAGGLALRRLSPGLALALVWAGALAQMGMGLSPLLANLAIFGVLYTTAAYGSRLVFWLGFASSFVGAFVATIYLSLQLWFRPDGSMTLENLASLVVTGIAMTVAGVLSFLLAWTSGALARTALRARATRLAQARAEAEAAAEHERVRIARDMHDIVAHSLAVIIAQADGARYGSVAKPELAPEALSTIASTARSALADVRLLLGQLRHTQDDGPQPTLADLEQLYAHIRGAGVDVAVTVLPTPLVEPPGAIQLAVYRILQEGLTNALKYGDGEQVRVTLAWYPERVEVDLRNQIGNRPAQSGGHGIIGMRERAQLVGGELSTHEANGEFTVRATLPIRGEETL